MVLQIVAGLVSALLSISRLTLTGQKTRPKKHKEHEKPQKHKTAKMKNPNAHAQMNRENDKRQETHP